MAMSLNRAQLIGNLTRDPELRQIPGGQTVASFGIATNFSWNDSSGQKQDKTEFHNIVAWRKLAEICGQYLKKGMKVYIEGRIQSREWEAEDGSKRNRTEIVAENMIMLSGKGGSGEGQSYGMQANHAGLSRAATTGGMGAGMPSDAGVSAQGAEDAVAIDDLPF